MSDRDEKDRLKRAKTFLLGMLAASALLMVLGAGPSGTQGSYQIVSATTGAGRIVVHVVDTGSGRTKVVSNGIRSQYDIPFEEMASEL